MATILVFWISLGLLAWSYLGYGLLLWPFNLLFPRKKPRLPENWPGLTLVVTAYNEGPVLEEKIKNCLTLDYPDGLLHVLFVTDGSTDQPEKILRSYPAFTHLHQPDRQGKYAALKRAMERVNTPIVVFSDANAMLNPGSLKNMIRHFQDEKVGGVAGEKKIQISRLSDGLGAGEGLYWEYESFLKKQDANFYSVIGAAGELYAIRTALFKPVPESFILDDFIISMQVCLQGFRMSYEPGGYAMESASLSLAEETKRKVRIAAGAYQAAFWLGGKLNPLRHIRLAFQYFSRLIIRWFFSPFLLVLLLASDLLLSLQSHAAPFYIYFLGLQLMMYLFALVGWILVARGNRAGLFTIPFYFVFMNVCQFRGLLRFLGGRQSVLWEKSLRRTADQPS